MTARGEAGQASVELVGVLPLVAIVALGAGQLLAAGAARVTAGAAAQAGAMAVLQGADPQRAARAAAPGWSHGDLHVEVADRRVTVDVTPRTLVPGAAGLLRSTARSDAGPRP